MESKTLRIMVFDHCTEDCTYTAEILREYFAGRGIPADVREFHEKAPLVRDYQSRCEAGQPYHMAFVGADSIKGTEIARSVRTMDEAVPLFLVSAVSELAVEGFRLRALDYLTKPVSKEAVEEAVARIDSSARRSL